MEKCHGSIPRFIIVLDLVTTQFSRCVICDVQIGCAAVERLSCQATSSTLTTMTTSHWGRDNVDAIFQTTFWNSLSSREMISLWNIYITAICFQGSNWEYTIIGGIDLTPNRPQTISCTNGDLGWWRIYELRYTQWHMTTSLQWHDMNCMASQTTDKRLVWSTAWSRI